MTAEETLKQSLNRARAASWAEGYVEGWAEGQVELLVKQLAFRFGTLLAHVRRRLAEATKGQLAAYAQRAMSAESIDDVLE
jgi:hypothetical protein